MTRLPRLTGLEFIFLRHADGRSTVVPVRFGETIGPGLTSKILRDCDLTVEQLTALL